MKRIDKISYIDKWLQVNNSSNWVEFFLTIYGDLNIFLKEFPFRERDILEMRYGLKSSGTKSTYKQIAEKWKVTPERIRQIEFKLLEKIRQRSY